MSFTWFKSPKVILTLVVLLLCSLISVNAQQLDGEQVKTAYLYNFLKHVNWPNDSDKKRYVIAIYQNDAFFQIVKSQLSGRQVKKTDIEVISADSLTQAAQADLVYVEVSPAIDITLLASDLRKTNTLLVTYNSEDKHNIMINLFLNVETSAIGFEINKSNIVYEGLSISNELLLLGGTEIDVAQLYRETEVAMQKMRLREAELKADLAQQSASLKNTSVKLRQLNEELEQRQHIAEQRQIELLALKKDINQQQQSLSIKEKQLSDVIVQLTAMKQDLEKQQSEVSAKELKNIEMEERIAKNRNIISKQRSQINQQGLQLDQKNVELEQRSALIEQQQFYLMILAIFISAVIFISILLVMLFIKNKKTTRKLSQTLTNLKEMQDQLVQSEKLASLGKLTAGIAHEINTPLGIAVTSTSSSLESTKEIKTLFEDSRLTKSAMKRYVTDMEHAAQLNTSSLNRVIELLNNFKQVAADQVVGEVRSINLPAYINEVMQTLSAELKRFHVSYQYSGEHQVEITTIPGALAQVLTNLVTNSLKHGFENRDQGNITIDVNKADDMVEVVYTDDGVGMNQEVLQNIFEPFFTTKRHSGGTGLGMNIVHNIIRQKLQGNISIESKPNEGAIFTLQLPLEISH